MAKTRRMFTREFQAHAIGLVTGQGKSLAEVARDLGPGEGRLRAWPQAIASEPHQAFPGIRPGPGREDSADEGGLLRAQVLEL